MLIKRQCPFISFSPSFWFLFSFDYAEKSKYPSIIHQISQAENCSGLNISPERESFSILKLHCHDKDLSSIKKKTIQDRNICWSQRKTQYACPCFFSLNSRLLSYCQNNDLFLNLHTSVKWFGYLLIHRYFLCEGSDDKSKYNSVKSLFRKIIYRLYSSNPI